MALAISSLQTGHHYSIQNFDEKVDFEVLDLQDDGDVKARHLHTLEVFMLSEITRYGKSKDFDLQEI